MTLRILHSLDSYLQTTENWIYPQIASVPNAESAVLCGAFVNEEEFPHTERKFILDSVPAGGGFPGRALRAALRRSNLSSFLRATRVRASRPDIIHAHFGTRGWGDLSLKRYLKVPLITTFYGVEAWSYPILFPKWRERYRTLFEEGDLFLVEGPAMAGRLAAIGCPAEKIRIRHLGVDVDHLKFANREFSRELKILMVGRFVEKKGFVDGLSGCLKSARQGVRMQITIIGDATGTNQKIKRELIDLANEPELHGRVRFAGFLAHNEVQTELSRHNVLLCPSKHAADGDAEGGMPFILAEAMALGLVGIGSAHCDMTELIQNGRTGFLFPEGNIEALSEKLCAIANRPELLSEIAKTGRAHIEKEFNLTRQLTALSEIYTECAR